jgi:hypothetical protein
MKPAIDVQATETTALAVLPEQAQQSVTLFRTDDPQEVIVRASAIATALKDVIAKQGLISNIGGKSYPKCEAWTLCGTMLGVFPVLVWNRPVEGGWEARVEARNARGEIFGAAEAQCLRTERNWSNRDDFAIRSMSQTRATAKALRMPLGFIMTLAGYSPTPAEEMMHENEERPASLPIQPKPAAPQPRTQPTTTAAPKATEKTREWLVKALAKIEASAIAYFQSLKQLKQGEALAQLPLQYVPTTTAQLTELMAKIDAFAKKPAATIEPPPTSEPASDEAWRKFPMPFGNKKGTPLADLDRKYLFGLWANYKPATEYNGTPLRQDQIEANQTFRAHLDALGRHYEFNIPAQ